MRALSVGVDFGTSNTVIAVVDDERRTSVIKVASRTASAAFLPSILCFLPNEKNPRDRPHSSAGADAIALALQDVRYAADASTTSAVAITNGSTTERNKWLELDYAGLAAAINKGVALQPELFSDLITDKADLTKLRDLGRKVIVYSGLVDDAIPPAGNINYHERVAAAMGGHAEVQKFMRMYLLPGSAHSSQGRAYAANGQNDSVPLPKLPGNANQTPTREQDQFFTALVDWVEKGVAPGEIMLTSKDNRISYPACVYPLRTTWNGSGPVTEAKSFACK